MTTGGAWVLVRPVVCIARIECAFSIETEFIGD